MANQKLRQEFKEAKKIVGVKNSQQSLAEEQRVTESKMEKERLCHNVNLVLTNKIDEGIKLSLTVYDLYR